MKLSAVLLARALAFVDATDLNSKGSVNIQELATELAKHFHFQKSPQTIEDYDLAKGIEFLNGVFGKRTIAKFAIWPNFLTLETRISTEASRELIGELLTWGRERFGLEYEPAMIARYAYVSDLSFNSEAPLLRASPLLDRIADRTTAALREIWHEPIVYEPTEIKIGHDPLVRKWAIAPFQIAYRADHKFGEGKYFSEAPLPTNTHISLLEEYEVGILELNGKKRPK